MVEHHVIISVLDNMHWIAGNGSACHPLLRILFDISGHGGRKRRWVRWRLRTTHRRLQHDIRVELGVRGQSRDDRLHCGALKLRLRLPLHGRRDKAVLGFFILSLPHPFYELVDGDHLTRRLLPLGQEVLQGEAAVLQSYP